MIWCPNKIMWYPNNLRSGIPPQIEVKEFVRSFDSTFDGFVPNERELDLLKKEFKLVVSKSPKTEYGNYLVDHYTYTYLYDENKNLRLLIPFDLSIEAIIKDVKRMVNNKLQQGLE